MSKYSELFKNPRWQKKRLEILERDCWTCQGCYDDKSTLNVHHKYYINGKKPWQYKNNVLVTLCDECHTKEHENMGAYLHELSVFINDAGFLSGDVAELCTAFSNIKMPHTSEVTSGIISFAFSSEDIMNKLKELYFESIESPADKS